MFRESFLSVVATVRDDREAGLKVHPVLAPGATAGEKTPLLHDIDRSVREGRRGPRERILGRIHVDRTSPGVSREGRSPDLRPIVVRPPVNVPSLLHELFRPEGAVSVWIQQNFAGQGMLSSFWYNLVQFVLIIAFCWFLAQVIVLAWFRALGFFNNHIK